MQRWKGLESKLQNAGMPSAGMLRRVALVRTEVSEERITSFIRVTRIDELKRVATCNRRTLRRNFFAACVGC
jgi:hypothetical protein